MSEIANIVSEVAASSYDVSHTNLKSSLKSLIDRAVLLAEGSNSWATNVQRLAVLHTRLNKPELFKKMFVKFVNDHRESFSVPLFPDSTSSTPTDAFFKDKETTFPRPSVDGSGRGSGSVSSLQGPVAFYDIENPDISVICYPIGEIYRAAIRKHVSTPETTPIPFLILYDFYSVIYHSLDSTDESFKSVKTNMVELSAVLEDLAPGTGPGGNGEDIQASESSMSNRLDGIFGILSSLAATATGRDEKEISGAIRGMSDTVSSIVDQVTHKTVAAGKEDTDFSDPMAIVASIGEVFQSKATQEKFAEATKNASDVFGSLLSGVSGVGGGAASETETPIAGPKDE